MHKVLKAFPCSFDGVHTEDLQVGDERDFGSMADGLKAAGLIGELGQTPLRNDTDELRDDGPTVAEYVAAGYAATAYPPTGYAPKSTPEEIAAAIKAEADAKDQEDLRSELVKLTVAQLRERAIEAKLELADDVKKAELIDAIVSASAASEA